MCYFNSTSSTTSGTDSWWLRSPYYQQFNVYEPYIFRSVPLNPTPPKKEMMTDEEFNVAFNDLLFGRKQEEINV